MTTRSIITRSIDQDSFYKGYIRITSRGGIAKKLEAY